MYTILSLCHHIYSVVLSALLHHDIGSHGPGTPEQMNQSNPSTLYLDQVWFKIQPELRIDWNKRCPQVLSIVRKTTIQRAMCRPHTILNTCKIEKGSGEGPFSIYSEVIETHLNETTKTPFNREMNIQKNLHNCFSIAQI